MRRSSDLGGPVLAIASGLLFGVVVIVGKPALDGGLTATVAAGGTLILTAAVLATLARGERLVEPDV